MHCNHRRDHNMAVGKREALEAVSMISSIGERLSGIPV